MLNWKCLAASDSEIDLFRLLTNKRKFKLILTWKYFQMLPTSLSEDLGNWSGPPNHVFDDVHGGVGGPHSEVDSDDDHDFISFSSADAEYFASANLNSLEDVAAAIEACKNNILETTENTSSRKAMVNRLIQLQIRQEDLREKNQVGAIFYL